MSHVQQKRLRLSTKQKKQNNEERAAKEAEEAEETETQEENTGAQDFKEEEV